MLSTTSSRRYHFALAIAATLAAVTGCKSEDNSNGGPITTSIQNTADLPPVYTQQQCADIIASFPGWANVTPVPEYDVQGNPTLWYAVIPITAASQLDDLATVGIDVSPMPIFTDDATEASLAGQSGVMTKSTCSGSQLVWALVPGPVFNAIATATVQTGETLVNAIIFQAIPDVFANTAIAYEAIHPVSYQSLHDAGYAYMGVNAPPPSATNVPAVVPAWGLPSFSSIVKSVVRTVAGATHEIPNLIERGIGWIDREIQGSVNLTVQLDMRNTDPLFGGPIGAKPGTASDQSTRMVRAWGAGANGQLTLPGVTVAAIQQTLSIDGHGIRTRFQGSTNGTGAASFKITKNKSTGICIDTENSAASIHDYLTRMEICSFEKDEEPNTSGKVITSYGRDTTITAEVQNNYLNLLAQYTDGQAYLQDVAHYTPHKLSVLAGSMANLISPLMNGRAMTPCLDFPNSPLDLANGTLIAVAEQIPVVGTTIAIALGAAEIIYEVDMWMPDSGSNLSSRGIPSHEYGHFAMCSLLYDEDSTKEVEIPSLMLQRIGEGSFADSTDHVAYIMEGWADFFAGQIASGDDYFQLEGATFLNNMDYCDGSSSGCWDLNYVEDFNDTPNNNGSEGEGFDSQVRRVATTLFDAFDGHARGGNDPGDGDFWTRKNGLFVPSQIHNGDAKDEDIVLAGPALRTFIHNWTHGTWPLGWAVSEDQFWGSLNATIRSSAKDPAHPDQKYDWCQACQMFAQHNGQACADVGDAQSGGECLRGGNAESAPLTPAQVVGICAQTPVSEFVGAEPAPSDPTSPCTFAGCPSHTILVGSVGDTIASCTACGPHQVATGTHACAADVCATPNVSASTCTDCPDAQVVGGTDGNTCVSCPALQVPNADRTACIPCGPHQIASGTSCVDCANDQIAAPSNTCQACPDGQIPYSNDGIGGPNMFGESCVPITDCTCTSGSCRTVNAAGICQDTIG